MIALIPARAGSQRVQGKNVRLLRGHPLIAYTIAAARYSGVFERILVCSDDEAVWDVAKRCQCRVYHRRPVSDDQPDAIWVRAVLDADIPRPASFAILRPTSPFRTDQTILRAYEQFQAIADCGDSLRAVRPVTEHPGKMWSWDGPGAPIRPVLDRWATYHEQPGFSEGIRVPWHSCPTQSLPTYYVQSSMLDMGWTANLEAHGTIHGRKVAPFFAPDHEHLSIDTEADWDRAVALAEAHPDWLPTL